PEAALAWLLLAKEAQGSNSSSGFDLTSFHHLFQPKHLDQLGDRSKEGAFVFLQVAKELGLLQRVIQKDFLGKAIHPRYLLGLNEQNPESVVEWLNLVREGAGERFSKTISSAWAENIH